VTRPQTRTDRRLILGYSSSILLVIMYLNMFPVVKYIVQHYGTTPVLVLPIVITVALLIVIFSFFLKTRLVLKRQASAPLIILGIAVCLAALIVPDHQAPVKRIHVIEYMVLSCLIRYTMSVRLQSTPLLIFSIAFTALLGVHDELLQGLHPLRTYGIRDIFVNALGSVGGGLIWHGFGLFEYPSEVEKQTVRPLGWTYLYLIWLFCSVLLFFIPLYFFREKILPIWPAVPLISSLILFVLSADKMIPSLSHGVKAVSCVSFTLILYLAAARLTPLVFL